ncbi:MAG TPA: hypothetical protein VE986_02025 [Hyphomicrobiales bacterium]|nr:hypothetical protein [Hyphomicrobiales bacterium]
MRWGAGALAAAAMMTGLQSGAFAFNFSDNSSDTWAGDVNAIALPEGTFLAIDYFGYRHGDAYITTPNNLLAKLGGGHTIPSTAEAFTDITRLVYFTSLLGRPLVLEAALPFAKVDTLNIGNFPTVQPNGFGPQTVADGFADPVLFFSYGLIVEPRMERFLALTNFFYLPYGRDFDKFSAFNTSTPRQFTWVPQVEYAEGLGKFAPGLKNFWIDVIANASIHTDGDAPFAAAPGIQFDRLTQENSYNLKAFLRYQFNQLSHIAVGVEKSWGGEQTALGGVLGATPGSNPFALGPTSFGKDDYLKGHLQVTYPIMRDLQVGADITHDFERSGGIREDITAEVRVTKFFIPAQEPMK